MDESVEFSIKSLGAAVFASPLAASDADHHPYTVDDDARILLDDRISDEELASTQVERSLLELAGPRDHICFEPAKTKIGIVTCGGL